MLKRKQKDEEEYIEIKYEDIKKKEMEEIYYVG
jgi:hypothetical protein